MKSSTLTKFFACAAVALGLAACSDGNSVKEPVTPPAAVAVTPVASPIPAEPEVKVEASASAPQDTASAPVTEPAPASTTYSATPADVKIEAPSEAAPGTIRTN